MSISNILGRFGLETFAPGVHHLCYKFEMLHTAVLPMLKACRVQQSPVAVAMSVHVEVLYLCMQRGGKSLSHIIIASRLKWCCALLSDTCMAHGQASFRACRAECAFETEITQSAQSANVRQPYPVDGSVVETTLATTQ